MGIYVCSLVCLSFGLGLCLSVGLLVGGFAFYDILDFRGFIFSAILLVSLSVRGYLCQWVCWLVGLSWDIFNSGDGVSVGLFSHGFKLHMGRLLAIFRENLPFLYGFFVFMCITMSYLLSCFGWCACWAFLFFFLMISICTELFLGGGECEETSAKYLFLEDLGGPEKGLGKVKDNPDWLATEEAAAVYSCLLVLGLASNPELLLAPLCLMWVLRKPICSLTQDCLLVISLGAWPDCCFESLP